MEIPLYQVDAFTDRLFWGNPAAVCLLEAWLPDEVMQAIALENNLPETAFLVPAGDDYALRWFTPAREVDLCGHATLGAAHVVFRHLRPGTTQVTFDSASGPLVVNRAGERIDLDFPALDFVPVAPPEALLRGLNGPRPTAVLRSMDYLVVYETEEQLLTVRADQEVLRTLDLRGVAITAPGTSGDFSSRWFGPKLSIPEDSVTGSAHCALVPYWARRLGSDRLVAHQFSPRLGRRRSIRLDCALRGDRVLLGGATREYLTGTVRLTTTDLDQRPKEVVTL
ncbi:PhzF family phenazine biosynthesis protein [Streptomyces sp. NPDC002324]